MGGYDEFRNFCCALFFQCFFAGLPQGMWFHVLMLDAMLGPTQTPGV